MMVATNYEKMYTLSSKLRGLEDNISDISRRMRNTTESAARSARRSWSERSVKRACERVLNASSNLKNDTQRVCSALSGQSRVIKGAVSGYKEADRVDTVAKTSVYIGTNLKGIVSYMGYASYTSRIGQNIIRSVSNLQVRTLSKKRTSSKQISTDNKSTGEIAQAAAKSAQSDKSFWRRVADGEISASYLSDEESGTTKIFGMTSSGTVSGAFLNGSITSSVKGSTKWKNKDGESEWKTLGVVGTIAATGALAAGTLSGNIGALSGSAEVKVGTATVSGEGRATLFEDGEFKPSLSIGGKASASVLEGSVKAELGSDALGGHASAEGQVLHAEAEGKVGAGYVGKDKKGNDVYGISAQGSAMASVAQGKVSGGVSILGVDIDITGKGYLLAAGVGGGAALTTSGVKVGLDVSAVIGAGAEVSIDWSDAVETVTETAKNAADAVDKAADAVEEWVDDTVEDFKIVGDFISDKLNR